MPRLIPFLAVLSSIAWVPPAPAASPAAEDWAIFDKPGKFITALCATDEALWVGTEDRSLWRLDLKADPAKAEAWQQFTSKDTATDHVYGIAIDSLGRVWVGTLNQGVSVFNGKEWRSYGVLDGCSGERVFAIAADKDPKRGNVWIGTDHGLTCWSPDLTASPEGAKGKWFTYTQAHGLPSQQVYAVAVTPAGRVWVGTECDGLAWSDPPYRRWTAVRAAAERSGDEGEAPGLNGGTGPGLPSNLSNDLLVLRDGTVVYSTNYGLGMGRGGGLTWTSWQGLAKQPYENYCRGLAEDPSGRLWIATRHLGLARLDGRTSELKRYRKTSPPKAKPGQPPPKVFPSLPDDYVFDVAVTTGGDVWAGTYGGGLARMRQAVPAPVAPRPAASPRGSAGRLTPADERSLPAGAGESAGTPTCPPLPQPAAPPTLDELNALLAQLSKVPFLPPEKQPAVLRLDDDWLTKGDCLGRYGRYWGCWCAICSPKNYEWGAGPEKVEKCAFIGSNCVKGDSLRYWVHWLHTKNPNTLEMPPTYCHSRVVKGYMTPDFTRRQAEWDDHGEAYPMTRDGPHLFCTLRIPAGLYTLSLYNFNKDGHGGNNRFRDYRFSIRVHPAGRPLREIEGFENRPELARGRMRDFWNGAYKRFLVRGPTEITFHQSRNHSHNAILAGVFLDLVDEYPVPYFHTLEEWQGLKSAEAREGQNLLAEARTPGARTARFRPGATAAEAAVRGFDELERMRLWNPVWWATEGVHLYKPLLRWYLAAIQEVQPGRVKQELYRRAATCYYRLGLYEKWEAGQVLLGKTPARSIEKALKWDGKTFSYQGKGYEIVTRYLEEHGLRPAAVGEGTADLPARAERSGVPFNARR